MSGLLDQLACHGFRDLFIEHLGWDHAELQKSFVVDGLPIEIEAVAQKRGFLVFHCPSDFLTIINRGRLRRLQRRVATIAHEHILIFSADQPRRQVWQWSICHEGGKRRRHHEHPFFSHAPPAQFLARLDRLRFQLGEEESIGLLDALARVRTVLGAAAELKLFANRPWYAEQSDRLYRAMKTGGDSAMHDFVLFHRPLADWVAKRFHRLYHHDEEDAQQLCMIGLMRAARLYDPSKGFQFSTYAVNCMRRTLQRFREQAFLIRLPPHVWPLGFHLRRELERTFASKGPGAVNDRLNALFKQDYGAFLQYRGFRNAYDLCWMDQRRSPELREVLQRSEVYHAPILDLVNAEWAGILRRSLSRLSDLDAKAVILKFGLDGTERTLEEVGQLMGITRERVRQRIKRGVGRLRRYLRAQIEAYFDVKLPPDDKVDSPSTQQPPTKQPEPVAQRA